MEFNFSSTVLEHADHVSTTEDDKPQAPKVTFADEYDEQEYQMVTLGGGSSSSSGGAASGSAEPKPKAQPKKVFIPKVFVKKEQ